jgi:hypothetical protein
VAKGVLFGVLMRVMSTVGYLLVMYVIGVKNDLLRA